MKNVIFLVALKNFVIFDSPGSSALDIEDDEGHVAHHVTRDDTSGSYLLDLAFRHGFKLDCYVRNGHVLNKYDRVTNKA